MKLQHFALKRRCLLIISGMVMTIFSFAQKTSMLDRKAWIDSVFKTLSPEEKIAQLIVVRMSSIDTRTGKITFYDEKVEEAVRKYKVGGICLFQGNPHRQATMLNHFQEISALPMYVTIDGETGLGMRMDSVRPLPRQMMMGAVSDPAIVYDYGRWVGQQCRRFGIHMNYAPVVDINNNPENPVINDRSFGENKEKVADYATMYMKGMQAERIMTCAKHFPGHGDVSVDSHLDLPVIPKTRQQLDSLELYPFRKLIAAGVDAVMVAHLSIPAIDNTANRASSISYPNITGLLKKELGFGGMIFTDALEMKGVTKYFPGGTISREAIIAGNDYLCLPEDIQGTIKEIRKAIRRRKLRWGQIDGSVKKLLGAKYDQGLANWYPTDLQNLTHDLNRESDGIRRRIAENAITLLKHNDPAHFPLQSGLSRKIAYLGIGINDDNVITQLMRSTFNADVFTIDQKQDSTSIMALASTLRQYDVVVTGIHQMRRFPAGQFGLSHAAIGLVNSLFGVIKNTVFVFGNPYATRYFEGADNLIACYEDERIGQETAFGMLIGKLGIKGRLPVTVTSGFPAGFGVQLNASNSTSAKVPFSNGGDMGLVVDSIANDAIRQRATPGMVVLAAKNGDILFHKAYGYYTYDSTEKATQESIYDMASVTKICATTISVMKLYDEGKLKLDEKLGKYIFWVRGTDKENLVIRDILLHQAGLKSFIPFYRETIDTLTGIPFPGYYSKVRSDKFAWRVADSMFMKTDWRDTMYSRIASSALSSPVKMVYSDNDFIFLGLVVEAISGMSLHDFAKKHFYDPLGLQTTGFRPRDRFPLSRIAPTESEKIFRRQLIRGDVHDPGAAQFGGISGHAGLFSSTSDLAVIMQMLLNGGTMNGRRYLSDTTIARFTAYSSDISHRALGFDKPYKDNPTRKEPYPAGSASSATFGHTGFTGIGAWADPEKKLVFLVFSNRVNPDGSNKFLQLSVRPKIHETVYRSLK